MMPIGPCRQHRALVVEAGHQHVDAAADLGEHVLLRHLAILEHQFAGVGAAHAELVELLRGGKSLHALFDDEGGDAARAGIGIGLGVDHQRIGDRAVGDPHLVAVEHEAVALLVGAGLHRDHVGAGAGLGHRERADMLAGNQFWQIFALLRLVAVAADLVDAEVGMRAVGEPDRRRRPRHLLHRQAMLEIAEARAAIFLLDRDAVQAERADFRPEVAGEDCCCGRSRRRAARSRWRRNAATVSRMASAVSPRSKLNIFCALGIMAGLPAILALLAQAFSPASHACHGKMIRCRIDSRCAPYRKTPPLRRAARRGCNRVKHCRAGRRTIVGPRDASHGRSRMHGTIDHDRRRSPARGAGQSQCDAACGFRSRRSRAVPLGYALAVFRPAAQGRAGPLLQGLACSARTGR